MNASWNLVQSYCHLLWPNSSNIVLLHFPSPVSVLNLGNLHFSVNSQKKRSPIYFIEAERQWSGQEMPLPGGSGEVQWMSHHKTWRMCSLHKQVCIPLCETWSLAHTEKDWALRISRYWIIPELNSEIKLSLHRLNSSHRQDQFCLKARKQLLWV